MKCVAYLAAVAAMVFGVSALQAEDLASEVVLEGLTNPTGIAVNPETGAVYVSDSGALRVIKIDGGKAVDVITGFPKDVYGKGPMYDIGPLGLCFLDGKTLVVGGGDKPDGEEQLRVYDLTKAAEGPIAFDATKFSFGLPAEGEEVKGEGNFYAVVATKDSIYVSSNGDDTKGWVARAAIEGDKIGPFERYLATKEAVQVDAPVGLAINPKGHLVVGQMGEVNVPGDSLLSFYNAKTKKLLLNIPTGLSDITGLAYSEKTGHLFATDFSWVDTAQGGLFKIIADKKEGGEQGAKTKKLATLDKPTALCFDKEGALLVTVIGTGDKSGKVLKFKPGL